MENKDAENIQEGSATPAPAAAVPPQVPPATPPVAAPATEKAEDKTTLAFIKMRKEKQANKARIAELESKLAAAPAAPVATPAPAQTAPIVQPQPAPKAEAVVSEDSVIQEMAKDSDVASVPGGIIDIMDLVDSDPKLVKLNAIDPSLAFREAKAMWKAKLGISTPPPTPAPVTVSGGISTDQKDLTELFRKVDEAKPGSKAYREAVKAVNEAMKK